MIDKETFKYYMRKEADIENDKECWRKENERRKKQRKNAKGGREGKKKGGKEENQ